MRSILGSFRVLEILYTVDVQTRIILVVERLINDVGLNYYRKLYVGGIQHLESKNLLVVSSAYLADILPMASILCINLIFVHNMGFPRGSISFI